MNFSVMIYNTTFKCHNNILSITFGGYFKMSKRDAITGKDIILYVPLEKA